MVLGQCHICGTVTKLSFEHVPPRSAFNDRPVVYQRVLDALQKGNVQGVRGPIQQRGAGGYTLCERCNNTTGRWYGRAYAEWAYQGLLLHRYLAEGSRLHHGFFLFPLRVIKQIVCMFFSVNTPRFAEKQEYLVRFVLNKDRRHLPDHIHVYWFCGAAFGMRQSGVVAVLRTRYPRTHVFSEVAFPPFGYVMAFESGAIDERLVDISFFAKFGYNDWKNVFLPAPLLPVSAPMPGDYRTEEQVRRDAAMNGSSQQL